MERDGGAKRVKVLKMDVLIKQRRLRRRLKIFHAREMEGLGAL